MVTGMDYLSSVNSQLSVCFSLFIPPPFSYAPLPPTVFPLSEAKKRCFISMARKQPAPSLPSSSSLSLSQDIVPEDIKGITSLSNWCCVCLCTVVNGSLLRSPFARQEMQGFIESYINETYCK